MKKIFGEVIKGQRRGTKLGFPTANVTLTHEIESGIYAGYVHFDGRAYNAALYVGPSKKIIEAHLLDFYDTLYGERIEIDVLQKVRDDREFRSEDELVAQISDDIEACVKILEPTH